MTQSGLICKVLGLAFCGLFLIGFETAKGSGAALPISTEADPVSETKKVIEKTKLPPAIHPDEAASRPERFSAQLEKPGSPQTTTGTSEQASQIVPLELPPPAVSSTRPGFTARGYTSRYFHIARPKVGLGLSYEYEEETTKAGGDKTEDTSDQFRESLPIEVAGWAYHPAFCKFKLGVVPEWAQTKRDVSPGPSASDDVFVPSYAADAIFLEPKPYTLHAFASRRELKLRSAFSQPNDTTIDKYGADLRLKDYKGFPTFVKYTHTDTDQSGSFDSTGEREDFQLTSQRNTKYSYTNLHSAYSDDDRTTGGDTVRVKTFDNNLGNEYRIAGDQRKSLLSRLRYRWTDNDQQEIKEYSLAENLYWRYTKNLFTNYIFSYDKRDTDAFDSERTTGRAGLQHLLYENLTTSISTGFNLNDFTGGEENAYDGDLEFFYTRQIPWGYINLRSGWNYRYTTREGEEAVIQVIDEPQVLTTGDVTLLDNENVVLDSIFVTDVTGTIAYIENADYTVEEVGSFTRISRTGGNIANGETVLVDYRFISDPAFDDTLFSQAYRIQFFLWNALTLSYGYRHADQDIVSGTPPENPTDDTTQSAEIRLDMGWTDTRLRYEDRDRSDGTSTRRWLALQQFRIRPLRRISFDITGSYGRTEFTDVGQEQEQYGVSSRLLWSPAGWCRFRMEGFYSKITGDVEDRIDANFQTVLDVSYRIWRGSAGYYYDRSGSSDAYRNRHALKFEILRILW